MGKSTIFNALTASAVPAENYPFRTVDPNVGVVPLPDPRLEKITSFFGLYLVSVIEVKLRPKEPVPPVIRIEELVNIEYFWLLLILV